MSDGSIDGDGSPIYGVKSDDLGVEIDQNGVEIDHFVSEIEPFPVAGVVVSTRLVLRVTASAYQWARGLSDHCSLNMTDLVWQALMRQADASGYHAKVPTRFVPKDPRRARLPRSRYESED